MGWTTKKTIRSFKFLLSYGSMYRGWLFSGLAATVSVVLFRLLLPWPLRGFIEIVVPAQSQKGEIFVSLFKNWGNPLFWLSLSFVLLTMFLGLSEMWQRIAMKKFAAFTIHEMRTVAIKSVSSSMPGQKRYESGEIISRLIGDIARIKAELSGILVHLSQNGLLFLGICVVFLFISPKLGLLFFAGGLTTIFIGYRMSMHVAANVSKQRKKEGRYAVMISDAFEWGSIEEEMEEINLRSARHSVKTTRLMTISSLLAHIALAVFTAVALSIGVKDIEAGKLLIGDLFLFIAYSLMVHRRMVQVGRQITRGGKLLANVKRIANLVRDEPAVPGSGNLAETNLSVSIKINNITLKSSGTVKTRPRLKNISTVLEKGTKILVTGKSGAGKSAFLELLAQRTFPDTGQIFWDDKDISDPNSAGPLSFCYLSQNPVFQPARLWRLLGVPSNTTLDKKQKKTLRNLGAWRLLTSLAKKINKKIGSYEMTTNEARAITIFRMLNGSEDVRIFDVPLEGLSKKEARKRLKQIIKSSAGKTVVISMLKPVLIKHFDRILVIKKGRIRFDGNRDNYKLWKAGETTDLSLRGSDQTDDQTDE